MELLAHWIQTGLSYVLPFTLLLGILIFVHELGHFLMARLCGVRVEVFSLGFGKKIFSIKRGDTTYCISIIPLGGYVKMFGEQPGEEIAESDKSVSFTHKSVWQRIAVVLAGPLMNFFFAVLVLFLIALTGEKLRAPKVGDVLINSDAYVSGLRSGDKITSVNNITVESYEQFSEVLNSINLAYGKLTVEREFTNEKVEVNVPLHRKPNPNILSTSSLVNEINGMSLNSASTIIGIKRNSPLKSLGVQSGDKITKINGQSTIYLRQLEWILSKQEPKSPLELSIERLDSDNKLQQLSVTISSDLVKSYTLENLGIESAEFYLAKIFDGAPAQKAGLQTGDRIVRIDGKPILEWADVVNSIKAYSGSGAMTLEIFRGDKELQISLTPELTSQPTQTGGEEKRYTVGILPYLNIADPEILEIKAANPIKALARGFEKTWNLSVMTVMSFVRLVENKISPKNIGGVIAIGQAASDSFKMGWDYFLQMMALISVNLFILNLLPIPVLDGGHLIFYAIEAIKGSPISIKKMAIAQQVGMILLMSLMVFAFFNDFSRLFSSM